jgi:hypothetical protein
MVMKVFISKIRLLFIIILAMVLLLGLSSTSRAAETLVNQESAQKAALAWLYLNPGFRNGEGQLGYSPAKTMLEIKDQDQNLTIAYLLELDPQGFIIVSPAVDLNPIIAFSSDSKFDKSDNPENILLDLAIFLKNWLLLTVGTFFPVIV